MNAATLPYRNYVLEIRGPVPEFGRYITYGYLKHGFRSSDVPEAAMKFGRKSDAVGFARDYAGKLPCVQVVAL